MNANITKAMKKYTAEFSAGLWELISIFGLRKSSLGLMMSNFTREAIKQKSVFGKRKRDEPCEPNPRKEYVCDISEDEHKNESRKWA